MTEFNTLNKQFTVLSEEELLRKNIQADVNMELME